MNSKITQSLPLTLHLMPNESLYLPILVNGFSVTSLLDSGSTLTLRMGDGGVIQSCGEAVMTITIENHSFYHKVSTAAVDAPAVLGYNFLKQNHCSLDFGEGTLYVAGEKIPCTSRKSEQTVHMTISESITIPPYTETLASVSLVNQHKGKHMSNSAVIEPTKGLCIKDGLLLARSFSDLGDDFIPIRLANFSDDPLKISRNTLVATGQPAEIVEIGNTGYSCLSQVCSENPQSQDDLPPPLIPPHLEGLWQEFELHLTMEQKEQASQILRQYQNLFSRSKDDIGRTDIVSHHIDTGLSHPIKQHARRLPLPKQAAAEVEISRLLDQGLIESCSSPWSSPVVLVKKKDGSLRFCVDYHLLNQCTIKDSYPLRLIEDSLSALGDANWFTTLDLACMYWQVPVHPDNADKTAFVTQSGLFRFKVLPFGLCNALTLDP